MELNRTLSTLFKLGDYILSNRIVLAPMPCLSQECNLSQPKIVNYYAQKASAGLIVTDPTLIAPLARFQNCPGIYSHQQVKKWRQITEEVHDRNGKIFLQLWYYDDVTANCLLGETLPTATKLITYTNAKEDLSTVVKLFRRAAQNALRADFDGVEIHAAFGYLVDRYLQYSTKLDREIEQPLQLLIRIIEEVASVWDEERVGVRIAPEKTFLGANVSNLLDIFYDLSDAFNFYDIAYVHLIESAPNLFEPQVFPALSSLLRSIYHGTIISNQDDLRKAQLAIATGNADLISFDKLIAC